MNHASKPLPKDVKSLTRLVLELRDKINDLQSDVTTKNAKIDHQSNYIDQLVEAIALAKQQYFGSRGQNIEPSSSQLSWLFNEAEAIADNEADTSDQDEDEPGAGKKQTAPRKRRTGGRKSLPDHFPHIEIIHSLDESDCYCDHCQGELKELGSKTSKQVELIPMTINVIVHVKKTYHCPNCKHGIKAAKLPPQPIPGSMASPGTMACVVGNKYVNGTPLYRQEKDLQRQGLPITRSTLASWMIKAGILIQPLINLMNDRLLIYDIVMMDETRCQVLKEPGKTPQSRSYMWCRRGGPADQTMILFDYAPTRSQQVPIELLGDYSGYLQVDAYGGYNKVVKDNALIRVGCWAHVMVKFKDAYKVQTKLKRKKTSLTAQAIKFIKALYKIEDEATTSDLTVQQRHALRQARSKPLLDQIRKWLTKHLPVVVKQSALGKAMHYMNDEWDTLTAFVQDGRLRLDNNAVENAIRPFVIGRKNSLFSDTVSGAKASANLYSLIETTKANDLEPFAYLKKVFTELPKATCVEDIEALLPFNPTIELEQVASVQRLFFYSFFLICLLVSMSGCGDKIIYDSHNSKIHGETIKFNVPMVYVVVEDDDAFSSEIKKYGYWLIEEKSAYDSLISENNDLVKIDVDATFTIVKSYWKRSGLVDSPFTEEAHNLVLKSEDGILSVCPIEKLIHTKLNESAFSW